MTACKHTTIYITLCIVKGNHKPKPQTSNVDSSSKYKPVLPKPIQNKLTALNKTIVLVQ